MVSAIEDTTDYRLRQAHVGAFAFAAAMLFIMAYLVLV